MSMVEKPEQGTGDADSVLLEVADGVAVVTLNRPDRLNAMTQTMGERLDRIYARLGSDPEVRVVVITGAGRGFCAGADMERLAGLAADGPVGLSSRAPDDPDPIFDQIDAPDYLRSRYLAPAALPQPVIAAIDGPCAGIGLSMAVACDIRFGSPGALFTAAFPRRGLTAEAGIAWALPRIIGRAAASDMLLSGRRVDAAEALRIGLLNAVHEEGLIDRALDYAREIASTCSPRSTRTIKRQLRLAADQSQREAIGYAFDEVVASLGAADFREGVASLMERRPARFTGY